VLPTLAHRRPPLASSRSAAAGLGCDRLRPGPFLGCVALVVAACGEGSPRPAAESPAADAPPSDSRAGATPVCDTPAVRGLVERFGDRLKQVPLLAPDSVVVDEVRAAYQPLVTPSLLDAWTADPSRAPGREVSSPWPERIEIDSVAAGGPGECRVSGAILYLTSREVTGGGEAHREPITLRVRREDRWRIAAVETGGSVEAGPDAPEERHPGETEEPGPRAAADVLRLYYDAVSARDYARARELWEDGRARREAALDELPAGATDAAEVAAEIGVPGRVEGAAGSRYVVIPVGVRTLTVGGEDVRFEGTYTLRRSTVEGASPQQRRWRIYSAAMRRVP
jgi:hypothetical protein